jgi:hypothetical protein
LFARPTSFSDFVVKSLKTLPYVAVFNGILFFFIGIYMVYSASSFTSRAEEASLTVVAVESRRGDNGLVYRPLFEAFDKDGNTLRYSGNTWVSPKPHDEGEIVDGLVDWVGSEIRSVSMIASSKTFGGMFARLGGVFFMLGGMYILWKRRNRALSK